MSDTGIDILVLTCMVTVTHTSFNFFIDFFIFTGQLRSLSKHSLDLCIIKSFYAIKFVFKRFLACLFDKNSKNTN